MILAVNLPNISFQFSILFFVPLLFIATLKTYVAV
jgi:hypothetical protein